MKKNFFLLLFISSLAACQQSEKKETPANLTTQKNAKIAEIVVNESPGIQVSSGTLYRIDSFPSNHIVPRPVDIWLPEGYSSDTKYTVLYMHDGQMLFDATTTWNKQEWKVDEWAAQLQKEGKTKPFIVVAPHNISSIRWNDYYPEKSMDYMPKATLDSLIKSAEANGIKTDLYADEYLLFLTQELKPYIDQNYSVLSNKENTFVAGSSMGGLISMYAVSEYPEIYGGAACISTHWPGATVFEGSPFPKAIFDYMKANLPQAKNHKFYFDYGTKTLDQFYPQYAPTVDQIFAEKGYDKTNFVNRKFEGADHSENSWNQRLDIPFTFLLGK